MTKDEVRAIHALIVAMLDEAVKYPRTATQMNREDRVNAAMARLLKMADDSQ